MSVATAARNASSNADRRFPAFLHEPAHLVLPAFFAVFGEPPGHDGKQVGGVGQFKPVMPEVLPLGCFGLVGDQIAIGQGEKSLRHIEQSLCGLFEAGRILVQGKKNYVS